tara:strand:- start:563 stop:1828 length:1266 start_codon:yes stop_codon:yes gene_type:complete
MGNNQENVEIADGETGEVFSVNVNSIVCDVRDRMLARRKMQTEATVWPKLAEHLQRDEIQEAHNAAFDIVRAVTELVATRGVELIHAQFKSAAIDDKCNIKIMLAGRTDDEQLVALNRVGSKILKIMVLDHEQFNAERTEIKPDADQPEMFNEDEKPEAPVEGAIADQLREAGYDVTQDANGNQEIEGYVADDAENYEAAVAVVRIYGKCSTSYIQRKLAIGYNKAAKLIERMEVEGVVTAANHLGKRDIIPLNEAATEVAEPDQETDDAETPVNEGDAGEDTPDDQEPIKNDKPETTSEPEGENGPMSAEIAAAQKAEAVAATEAAQEIEADPYAEGQKARVEGLGPDDNPHDGGTDGGNAWAEGYTDADGEIDQLIGQGYESRKKGEAPEKNPWKAKSRENGWWQQGYDKAKGQGLPEE